jgi:hypothetical protein
MVQKDRVVFFSKQDMASGYMLEKAEKIFDKFDESFVYTDINDIIELYHIKQYIDADLFLLDWSDDKKTLFKASVSKFWAIIQLFMAGINDDNAEAYYNNIADYRYFKSFWELIDKSKAYKKISCDSFRKLLNARGIRDILEQNNIVKHYNKTIRNFLMGYDNSAEILLSKYEKDKGNRDGKIYLPESLTLEDKITILDKYLDWEDANLNYIGLIEIAKKTSDFNVPDKIRLKAKKRHESDRERLLSNNSVGIGYQIGFSDEQKDPISVMCEGLNMMYSYSVSWIKEHFDTKSLFQNFRNLFGFLDEQYRISLVSKQSESSLMDIMGVHSQNEYPASFMFATKNNTAWAQTISYSLFLDKLNVSLDDVVINAFNEYSISKKIEHLNVNSLSKGLSNLEKIRFLLPELESLMKKYKTYVENDSIDPELLAISSNPCRVQDIPSAVKKKYVYGINDKIGWVQYCFFSDQSMLYYIETCKDKYQSLWDLLINENVKLSDLQNYQIDAYQKLISEQYLVIENEYIRVNKPREIAIYKELWQNDVISYYHLTPLFRCVVDELHLNGFVEFGDTLLSGTEINYFNYYLNRSEFTNGADLRNKYAHGTHHHDQKNIDNDYYWVLILLVLLESKIIDDIDLSQEYKKD